MKESLSKKILAIIAVLAGYFILNNLWRWLGFISFYSEINQWIRYLIRYSYQLIFCLLFTFLILKFLKQKFNPFETLGLKKPFFQGLYLGLIFTLPMLIGYALVSPFNQKTSGLDILFWAFIAGFMEEVMFRGYFFGLLFRQLKIGFIPSILVVSSFFGIGHFYQGNDLMSTLGVFGITFLGSILFAWVYVEWNYNLWVAIWLHILMNLSWFIFDVGASNALGGWEANIFRLLTVSLVIFLTVKNILKKGSNLKNRWVSLSNRKTAVSNA